MTTSSPTDSPARTGAARWVRPELQGIPPYTLDLTPCRFKLDQNECAWELPRPVRLRVAEGLVDAAWGRYPDFHGDALREALARRWNWPAEGILVGNGSNELLGVVLDALAGPGRSVLGADPTFGLYRRMIQRTGATPNFLPPRPDLRIPRQELRREILESPERPVLLCSPNNPTGDALAVEEVEALLEPLQGPLLLDAAYQEFGEADYRPLLDRFPNLVLFGTFSKAWGLGGIRLGYLLAQPDLVAALLAVKLPYNVGHAAVLAGLGALEAQSAVQRRIAATVALRLRWSQMLQRHGLEVFPSRANFLLVRVAGGTPASTRLFEELEARSIRVRNVAHYPGLAGCLRISIGSSLALRAVDRALGAIDSGRPRPERREVS